MKLKGSFRLMASPTSENRNKFNKKIKLTRAPFTSKKTVLKLKNHILNANIDKNLFINKTPIKSRPSKLPKRKSLISSGMFQKKDNKKIRFSELKIKNIKSGLKVFSQRKQKKAFNLKVNTPTKIKKIDFEPVSALKNKPATTKAAHSFNIKCFSNRSQKRKSVLYKKDKPIIEKRLRIISRDKIKQKSSNREKQRPIEQMNLFAKLNRLSNNRPTSMDLIKRMREQKKFKRKFTSFDKRQRKFFSNPFPSNKIYKREKSLYSTAEDEDQVEHERTRKRYLDYLINKSEKEGRLREIKKIVKRNFTHWKDTDLAEFYNFVNSIDCYKIGKKIGSGVFGQVFLAVQIITNTKVALKKIKKDDIKDDKRKQRIEKEVEILKRVSNNKSIIRLFEVFEDKEHVYLVFEYLGNGDMAHFFRSNSLFEETKLKQFFFKLLKGLQYIHKKNIIHRDIKLDNVLLDKTLGPKLCDFGISTIVHKGEKIFDTGGTPAYLAPEVINRKGEIHFKTDIWSLGVLLYMTVFAEPPFMAETVHKLYKKIKLGNINFPEESQFSSTLMDLIQNMLVVDVKKRFSVEECLNHYWFEGIDNSHSKDKERKCLKEKAKREAILLFLNQAGFPDEFICQTLEKGLFNHVKACYDSLAVRLKCS